MRRTISTFCCDIARPVSRAAGGLSQSSRPARGIRYPAKRGAQDSRPQVGTGAIWTHSSPSETLIGATPLVVSGGFMSPSVIAVILSCLGLSEQLGRVGRFAIGPGGPLVRGGGALMLAPLRPLGVELGVVGHSREPTSAFRLSAVG